MMNINGGMTIALAARRAGYSPRVLSDGAATWGWYDPHDAATRFTDTGGTTPAAANADIVRRINDKSGNGWHASQAAGPTLSLSGGVAGLSFNGTSNFLQTSSVNPGVDNVQIFAAIRKASDAATGLVLENSFDSGSFSVGAPNGGGGNYFFASRGSLEQSISVTGFTAPSTNVICCIGDISGDRCEIIVDGVSEGVSSADQGTGNFGNYPMTIGGRAGPSLFFNGLIYGLIWRYSAEPLDAGRIASTIAWMAGKLP